jgi:uncharacterized protein (DUF342 family)
MDDEKLPALSLKMSADKMSVTGEVLHFVEGHHLACTDVQSELETLSVLPELIDQPAILRLLQFGEPTVIAQGIEAEHGLDAVFTETFFIDDDDAPNIDTADVAHYYQTKRYITVNEGDVVMRRVPAFDGKDGTTVVGKVLKAKKGKNPNFKKYAGTEVSDSEGNVLIASVKGHPVLQKQGVKIDETLTVAQANLKTGNINFDGSVVINGDVLPQVSVMATGDVFIKGTVENASVEAGNNIVIGGGVISESLPGVKEPPKITTKIKAGGEVHAKFLTQTSVKAVGDIRVQNFVMNSEVVTKQSLLIGEKGGKGRLIGGETIAAQSITANELGSVAYVPTEIHCGDVNQAHEKYSSTSSLLHQRIRERDQMREILRRIKNDPAPTLGEITLNRRTKITAAIKNINKIVKQLRSEQTKLQGELVEASAAFIEAKRAVYPCVSIVINRQQYAPNDERRATKITCPEGELIIE